MEERGELSAREVRGHGDGSDNFGSRHCSRVDLSAITEIKQGGMSIKLSESPDYIYLWSLGDDFAEA
jgi:hypothetical protein